MIEGVTEYTVFLYESPWASSGMEIAKEMKFGTKVA